MLCEVLKGEESNSACVPKRISSTRWSCRADATKALVNGYSQIRDVLHKIVNDKFNLAEVRCKAQGLHARMLHLETGIYAML